MLPAQTGLPADKAYKQFIDSRTAYPRQVRLSARSHRGANLPRAVLEEFETDWQKQWLVERGIEIISEASRHLPAEMKTRHPDMPWRNIAGIGNILRHNYEHVSAPILYALVQNKLPSLEQLCRDELAANPEG